MRIVFVTTRLVSTASEVMFFSSSPLRFDASDAPCAITSSASLTSGRKYAYFFALAAASSPSKGLENSSASTAFIHAQNSSAAAATEPAATEPSGSNAISRISPSLAMARMSVSCFRAATGLMHAHTDRTPSTSKWLQVTFDATRIGCHPAGSVKAFSTTSVDVSPFKYSGVLLSLWCVSVGSRGCVQSTHTVSVPRASWRYGTYSRTFEGNALMRNFFPRRSATTTTST